MQSTAVRTKRSTAVRSSHLLHVHIHPVHHRVSRVATLCQRPYVQQALVAVVNGRPVKDLVCKSEVNGRPVKVACIVCSKIVVARYSRVYPPSGVIPLLPPPFTRACWTGTCLRAQRPSRQQKLLCADSGKLPLLWSLTPCLLRCTLRESLLLPPFTRAALELA